MKRWFKAGIITLSSLLSLIVVVVGVACYLVFTPARLTAIVNKAASQYLTCEMEVGKIDLTLFSSFPNVTLLLSDVALVNPTDGAPNDTVAAIAECDAVLDIKELLGENAIVLRRLCLKGGEVNLYIPADGKSNFMVFATDSVADEDTVSTAFELPDLDIQEITVNDVNVTYRDDMAGQYAAVKDFDLTLAGQLKGQQLQGVLASSLQQVAINMEGESPITATMDGVALQLNGDLNDANGNVGGSLTIEGISALAAGVEANVDDMEWLIDGTINDKCLTASTTLTTQPVVMAVTGEDPISAMLGNAQVQAEVKADEEHISLIPQLMVNGLNVVLGEEQMLSQATIKLYAPLWADTALQTIDLSKAEISLNEYVVGLDGRINLQDTATMDADLQFKSNHWDIPSLLALVPDSYRHLLDGIQIKGGTALQGRIRGGMQQGEVALSGAEATLALDDIDLLYNDSIALQSRSATLALTYQGDSDKASGSIKATNLDVEMTGVAEAQLCDVEGDFVLRRALRMADGYIDAQAQIAMAELTASMDTMGLYTRRPVIDLAMKAAGAASTPLYNLALRCDTLHAAMGGLAAASTGPLALGAHAAYDAAATDLLAQWNPHVNIDLQTGHIATTMLPLPIDVPHIEFDYDEGRFTINDSRILLGNSDFALRGDVYNIDSFLNETGLLKAELDFTSSFTDVTQLMDLVSGLGSTDTVEVAAEEEAVKPAGEGDPFMVPLGFDVRLNTDILTANVNGFKFDNIGGHVTVKDGVLVLEEMGFTSDAARMQLTAMYKSPRKDHLFVGFDFHLLDIEIDQLIHMIPDVDSIVPMLSAFDGEAQFHLAAETYLRSNYDLKMSTLRAAGAIEGKDLAIRDNETFSQIAQMLQFNKNPENLVDSISVELSVFRDKVTLYPFLIAMDNYKAVIGGRHNIDSDLSFNYHISLTDCPLPVRLGLDVSGTLDDMSFKLAPCKYAHLYHPEKQNVVQERTLQLKQLISDSLKDNVKPQERKPSTE